MKAPLFIFRLGLLLVFVLIFMSIFMGSPATNAPAHSMPRVAGKITEYTLPPNHNPWGSIARGPDGNLWFTENIANAIGRMTPKGALTQYSIGGTQPDGITVGPDTNLWFVAPANDAIGTITWK